MAESLEKQKEDAGSESDPEIEMFDSWKPKQPGERRLIAVASKDSDQNCRTFVIKGEDHTLGNALKGIISKYPEVNLCAYSIPHPSEQIVHLRVQCEGISAEDILRRAFQQLSDVCDDAEKKFKAAVKEYWEAHPDRKTKRMSVKFKNMNTLMKEKNIDPNAKPTYSTRSREEEEYYREETQEDYYNRQRRKSMEQLRHLPTFPTNELPGSLHMMSLGPLGEEDVIIVPKPRGRPRKSSGQSSGVATSDDNSSLDRKTGRGGKGGPRVKRGKST